MHILLYAFLSALNKLCSVGYVTLHVRENGIGSNFLPRKVYWHCQESIIGSTSKYTFVANIVLCCKVCCCRVYLHTSVGYITSLFDNVLTIIFIEWYVLHQFYAPLFKIWTTHHSFWGPQYSFSWWTLSYHPFFSSTVNRPLTTLFFTDPNSKWWNTHRSFEIYLRLDPQTQLPQHQSSNFL